MPGGFFSELKRRNVLRVAVLYVGASWLILQIADVLAGLLGLPDWALRVVAYFLLLALPFALIVAWLFEVTPEGIRRTAEVDASRSMTPATARRIDRLLVPLLLLVIAGLLVDRLWVGYSELGRVVPQAGGETAPAATRSGVLSLAVLPFEDLSDERDSTMFVDGIHDQVITQLARIDRLRVISRSSVMEYRGRNTSPRQVAQALGVVTVLQGSVQKSGERARINVQLIDAGTEAHLWSESWDFTIADVFDVQNRVALGVASALQIQLAFPERARMERIPTTSLPAYQLYLRAGAMDPYSSDGLRAGVDLLRQATTLDPDFALAWAELSRRYGRLVAYDSLPAEELARAEDYARRAVALDPDLAEGHHALGLSLWRADRSSDARDSLLAALRVNPNYDIAMNNLSLIELNLGRFDQSLFWALEGFRRQPERRASYYHVGLPLLLTADEEVTRGWLDAGNERHADYHRLEVLYALLDLYHGRREQAAARMEDSLARYPDNEEVLSMAIDVGLLTDPSGAAALARAGATAAPDSRTWFLSRSRRACLGYALVAAGAGAEGESVMREALAAARERAEGGADAPALLLEIAGLEAMSGERDAALDWLHRAREAGWRDYVVLEQDPFLDPLRAAPQFRALLDRMRADVAGMRERSRDLVAAVAALER